MGSKAVIPEQENRIMTLDASWLIGSIEGIVASAAGCRLGENRARAYVFPVLCV